MSEVLPRVADRCDISSMLYWLGDALDNERHLAWFATTTVFPAPSLAHYSIYVAAFNSGYRLGWSAGADAAYADVLGSGKPTARQAARRAKARGRGASRR